MERADINGIVERTAQLVAQRYVFPDVADSLAKLLREHSAAGRYHRATDAAALATLVTEDLQSVNNDLHLRLKHHEEALSAAADDPMEEQLPRLVDATMGGIAGVRHLDGNIGHLEVTPYLFPPVLAGAAMVAAMQLLARTDALIIDLRRTHGGDPDMSALVCGYLFDEPTHLISMYEREGDRVRQSWSPAYVPGPRFGGSKPVYVLTSAATFSGGEDLSYGLQQHGRATVVGERTRGGAHPRIGVRVHPHLEVTIPVARPVHPVSGTNWEGCGVAPDIEVPADEALEVAHRAALAAVGTPSST